MIHNKFLLVPVLSTLAAVGRSAPQLPHASGAPGFVVAPTPTDRVWTDVEPDGSIWARGDGWKARFGSEGLRYLPLLGPGAPEDFSLGLRLRGVHVGGRSLAITARTPALVAPGRIEVDQGSVTESWTLEPRAIEHVFRFDELASRGEISVRVDIDAPAPPSMEDDGLRFSWSCGSVLYGRASAFDAAGRRIELASAWIDGGIEIVVPEEFVATAALPLTIDPVIVTFTVVAPSNVVSIQDAAYDPVGDRWLVVLTQEVSSSDLDVLTRFYDANGNAVAGSDLFLDLTTDSWILPRAAYLARSSSFLIVAELSPTLPHSIIGRVRSGNTLAPKITISGSEPGNKFAAEIGGDPFGGPGPSFWCVVWGNAVSSFVPGQVSYRMIDQNGVPVGTAVLTLDSAYLGGFPQISKSDGQRDWTVVWQDTPTGAAPHKIRAAQVRWDGSISSAAHTLFDDPGVDYTEACISSPLDASLHTVMCYSARPTGDPVQHVEVANLSSSALLLHTLELGTTPPGAYDTRVDSNGTHALAIWVSQTAPTGAAVHVLLSEIYDASGTIGRVTPDLAIDSMLFSAGIGACASAHSSGAVSPRYIASWNAARTFSTLDCVLFDGVAGGPVTSFCHGDGSGTACPCGNSGSTGHGCGNSANAAGALLSTTGNASTTSDTLVLIGSGQPATTSGLYFQGTTSAGGGTVFGDGLRCAIGTVVRLGTKSASGGVSQYPTGTDPSVSVRGLVGGGGGTRFYQLWYRNAAAFCTTATFNLSNGVMVVWTP